MRKLNRRSRVEERGRTLVDELLKLWHSLPEDLTDFNSILYNDTLFNGCFSQTIFLL